MANPYFGDFGDVLKHLMLTELLSIERPRAYWETHAGSARYALTRSDARNYGVYHFLEHAGRWPVLRASRYHTLLDRLPHVDGSPGVYPGSALLAMLELGTEVQTYLLCDRDPASVADLEAAARDCGVAAQARCLATDGVATILGEATDSTAPPLEQVLVHIDPFDPFEQSGPSGLSPFELACWLSERGCKVIYWYAYDQTAPGAGGSGWAWRAFAKRVQDADHSAWCGDIGLSALAMGGVAADVECGGGCGLVCANFARVAYERVSLLGEALAELYAGSVFSTGQRGALTFRTFGVNPAVGTSGT